MAKNTKEHGFHFEMEDLERIQSLEKKAPWILRITEHKDKPSPVLIVKERYYPEDNHRQTNPSATNRKTRDRGLLYGQPLRRCLPVIRQILSSVCDEAGTPLELHRFLGNGQITFRGNLPLDHATGPKLSLIFKLSERVLDMDRVELIAWRVARFTAEEANYWLTRSTQYGAAGSRWALAGMRIMLGGQPGDKSIQTMLEKLRKSF